MACAVKFRQKTLNLFFKAQTFQCVMCVTEDMILFCYYYFAAIYPPGVDTIYVEIFDEVSLHCTVLFFSLRRIRLCISLL